MKVSQDVKKIKKEIQNFLINAKENVETNSKNGAVQQIINLLSESTVTNIAWYEKKMQQLVAESKNLYYFFESRLILH